MSVLLHFSGVVQDEARQITRGVRGVDRPRETALEQQRQPANVVEVRVREQHRVEPLGVQSLGHAVFYLRVSAALKHAKVEQEPGAVGFDQVSQPGYLAGSAVESDLHLFSLILLSSRSNRRRTSMNS